MASTNFRTDIPKSQSPLVLLGGIKQNVFILRCMLERVDGVDANVSDWCASALSALDNQLEQLEPLINASDLIKRSNVTCVE